MGVVTQRGRSTSTPPNPVQPAQTVEVRARKVRKGKGKTPLERSAAGYVAPAETNPAPDPELEILNLALRRARAWCRQRHGNKLWGQLVALTGLAQIGVAEQPSRHVAMLAEALYAAADQDARVHRCGRGQRKCFLCDSEAYDSQAFDDGKEVQRVADKREATVVAYVDATERQTEWRQRVLDLTGMRVGDELDEDELWQLLNQVDYALESYADACAAH